MRLPTPVLRHLPRRLPRHLPGHRPRRPPGHRRDVAPCDGGSPAGAALLGELDGMADEVRAAEDGGRRTRPSGAPRRGADRPDG